MSSIASKIAKNTSYLSLSSVVQKVLAFGFYIYLADQLGDELLGRYAFALSFTGIFVIIMNFGFVPVLTREGSKDDSTIQDRLEHILAVKAVLAAITLALMFSVYYLLGSVKALPVYTNQLVYIASVVILLDTFRSVFLAVLRAKQKMLYEAMGQILYQLTVVIGGVIVLSSGFSARAMVMIIGLASAVYFVYAVYAVIVKAGIRPRFSWQKGDFMTLMKMAAPFALADIFFKLNGSIDTVMLEYLAGDRYVAWYNIALKLTVTLTIIPGSFATAFFPAMSKAYVSSKDQLRLIFEQVTEYLLVLATPISFGAFITAPLIIGVAFKGFPASTSALQIFMASLVFLFVNYPIGNLLNAVDKQTTNTANMGIALGVNIALNIWLIPQYTYNGAAIAAVVSSLVLVALGVPHVRKVIQFSSWKIFVRFFKTVVAGLAMVAVIYAINRATDGMGIGQQLMLDIVAGAAVYTAVLFLVRGITVKELLNLKSSLRSR